MRFSAFLGKNILRFSAKWGKNKTLYDIVLVNEDVNAKFTIFAANFKAMQLSEQQKTIVKAAPFGLIGMLGVPLFNALIGRQTWMDTLWDSLISIGVWAVLLGLFLLGSRVPVENAENQ